MLKFRPPFGQIEQLLRKKIMHRRSLPITENIIINNNNDELRHLGIKKENGHGYTE